MVLSIIIPARNEERTINTVIDEILLSALPGSATKDIIVVDDGSTDATPDRLHKYADNPLVRVFRHHTAKGKGSAVKSGIEKSKGDVILIQDADLEYSPKDYPELLGPIIRNETSIVYGSRFKGRIGKMPLISRAGNMLSNITLNILFRSRISDVNTCYKVFKKALLADMEITSEGFQFDTEITAKFLKRNYSIIEVPINYSARLKSEGRKMSWIKAVGMYLGLIKYRIKK